MNKYIGAELDRRYEDYKKEASTTRKRAVIDLILQAYLPEDSKAKPEKLDAEFRAFAIRQMRLFVFVGHDSTSSTITHVLHCLSQNPEHLAKIRAEHDEVFGKDRDAVSALIAAQPHLTNNLPYTIAVIKETLRLFPPAGTSRQGVVGENVVNDVGQVCPTDEAMIWIPHIPIHKSPKYWVRPEEFIPERWLVEPGHELYPVKGAWRAFEHGGRNCMAQGLVMMELRVVLAIIVRQFDFKPAYDEWDLLYPGNGGSYRGERLYLMEGGSSHPVEHYPCRVSVRS
jgi:cytochrome P450